MAEEQWPHGKFLAACDATRPDRRVPAAGRLTAGVGPANG